MEQRRNIFILSNMGKIKQGILGPFSGTVGSVVGIARSGNGYMRGKAISFKDANSQEQQVQRGIFKTAQSMVLSIKPYLEQGYKNRKVTQSPYNAFVQDLFSDAVDKEAAQPSIDYSKLKVTTGTLRKIDDPSVTQSDGKLVISWQFDESNQKGVNGSDYVMPLIYNPDKEDSEFSLTSFTRSDNMAEVKLPSYWKGDKVVAYVGVTGEDGKNASRSIYLGEFTVE